MKKIFLFALAAVSSLFIACEGPEGPQGAPGVNIVGETFEVTTTFVNDADPYFAYRSFFDLNPAIYASDVIQVYELVGVEDGLDVWKPLPQVYMLAEGILQYNYDFTTNDFSIFLDADFDRTLLNSSWTNNRTFRIVIIPSDFSTSFSATSRSNILNDYYALTEALGIKEADVKPLQQISKK